jgi:hypothetical protein
LSKGFVAARNFAAEWFLASVDIEVFSQVLAQGETLLTNTTSEGFYLSV